MRTKLLLLFLGASSALVFYGCSSNGGGGTDGGTDGASDAPSSQDAATDAPSSQDATTDAPVSDASGDAAGDGGVTLDIKCTSPSGCDGGTPVCCGTIALNGGTPPACDVSSIASACTTANQCQTKLPFSCTASDTVRLCSQPSDCTEPSYDKCCTFTMGTQSTTFCANTTIASAAGATCM